MDVVININSQPRPIQLDGRKEKIEERTKTILEEYERLKQKYNPQTMNIYHNPHPHPHIKKEK